MGVGGAALKAFSTTLRALQFLAALVILGIFSYFLVYLRDNNLEVLTFVRAVEGISGAAALYALIAFFLTCCLGGLPFFAFVAIVLDICFLAAFIAVTVLTRGGNSNCSALGPGANGIYYDGGDTVSVDMATAQRICNMYKATFAISIILIGLFLLSAVFQLFLGKHHQREKRNGTYDGAAAKRPFWKYGRGKKNKHSKMEQGAVPVTGYANHGYSNNGVGNDGYSADGPATNGHGTNGYTTNAHTTGGYAANY